MLHMTVSMDNQTRVGTVAEAFDGLEKSACIYLPKIIKLS